jgi:hypothetical protein
MSRLRTLIVKPPRRYACELIFGSTHGSERFSPQPLRLRKEANGDVGCGE